MNNELEAVMQNEYGMKEAAKPMFAEVVRKLPREHTRSEAQQVVRNVLDTYQPHPQDRRFLADHLMAKLGYGGGF